MKRLLKALSFLGFHLLLADCNYIHSQFINISHIYLSSWEVQYFFPNLLYFPPHFIQSVSTAINLFLHLFPCLSHLFLPFSSLGIPWYYGLAIVWISSFPPKTLLVTMKKPASECLFLWQYCSVKHQREYILYFWHVTQKSSILEPPLLDKSLHQYQCQCKSNGWY